MGMQSKMTIPSSKTVGIAVTVYNITSLLQDKIASTMAMVIKAKLNDILYTYKHSIFGFI